MQKTLISVLVVALLVGSGAFYGGTKYAQNKTSTNGPQNFRNQQLGGNVAGNRGGNRGGFGGGEGFTAGDILSKDDKSITIKLRDGGSKLIFFSDKVEISKFVSGALQDLEIGKTVMVNGKTNQDGSITADSLQLRPSMPALSTTSTK